MAKRGRPSERLKREISEGRVWSVICRLRENRDFSRTIRDIARLSRCSVGAVAKTKFWKGYLREKRASPSSRRVVTRRRGRAASIEGLVMQVIMEGFGSARDHTVRSIAAMIGCSSAAVGKTHAWRAYAQARIRPSREAMPESGALADGLRAARRGAARFK